MTQPAKPDDCPVKAEEPAIVYRVIARSEATRRSPGTKCRFWPQYQEIATACGLAMTAAQTVLLLYSGFGVCYNQVGKLEFDGVDRNGMR